MTSSLSKDSYEKLLFEIEAISNLLSEINRNENAAIDWDSIISHSEIAQQLILECISALEEQAVMNREKHQKNTAYDRPEDYGWEIHHLSELSKLLSDLRSNAASDAARSSNSGALLVKGNAGVGKTHLLCDIAKSRVEAGLPIVMLLGWRFRREEPWRQILDELHLNCTADEFLRALECVAQISGSRALIIIDALNESDQRHFWKQYLGEMIAFIARYPWVAFAISIRSSYEQVVIPDSLGPDKLVRIEHTGFGNKASYAAEMFFDKNGIERPAMPLLLPEFTNPQFLMILCKGLKNRNLTRIPPGIDGLNSIFEFLLDSINDKLAKEEALDFDPRTKAVHNATLSLAKFMADNATRTIQYSVAKQLVDGLLTYTLHSKSLLQNLISEGIIIKDLDTINGSDEIIQFAYERFGDMLIAKHLLASYLDPNNPDASFSSGKLSEYFQNDHLIDANRGILDAVSIILPEVYGKDLIEIRHLNSFYQIKESFIESLSWRSSASVTAETLNHIQEFILSNGSLRKGFLRVLLKLSPHKGHRLNADFLHNYLVQISMSDRDYVWSIFLHEEASRSGDSVVRSLISWASFAANKTKVDDESIRLYGIVLLWFLTSSNRLVRDRATKALVSLLKDHLNILNLLVNDFVKIDDPYVVERMLAVSYGCTLLSNDIAAIKNLTRAVFDNIFRNGCPPPHILIRDYARGIIEAAVYKQIDLQIDLAKIRPPYITPWIRIPSARKIQQLKATMETLAQSSHGWHALEYSVTDDDFARYILGTNSNHFQWSGVKLLAGKKSRQSLLEAFPSSFKEEKLIAWKNYLFIQRNIDRLRMVKKSDRKKIFGFVFKDGEFDKVVYNYKRYLRKNLTSTEKRIFDKYIAPYVESANNRVWKRFDISWAQRWILQRVVDLGWTSDKFGEFDFKVNYRVGREPNKPERIGKKYQWIAYHQFLSYVSDNFELDAEFSDFPFRVYHGSWQIWHGRDTDPSFLLRRTLATDSSSHHTASWWFPIDYDAWDLHKADIDWIKKRSDLPSVKSMIEVSNPLNNSRWLALEGHYHLEQPVPTDEERYDRPCREVWLQLRSYIVQKRDAKRLISWLKKRSLMGRWMPESAYEDRIFLLEYYWALSVADIITAPDESWIGKAHFTELPTKICPTAFEYSTGSGGYDCSIDQSIRIKMPSWWITREMKLTIGMNGKFSNTEKELIAYDPSVDKKGPSVPLISREKFLDFLESNGYAVIWTILGEKRMIGGNTYVWKGDLEINGIYMMINGQLRGSLKTKFVNRRNAGRNRKM